MIKDSIKDSGNAAIKMAVLKIVIPLIGVVAAGFGVKYVISNFHSEIRIMNTPTVVQEIKKIAELTTVTYVEDLVLQDSTVKYHDVSKVNIKGLFSSESIVQKDSTADLLVLVQIATGRIRAGFDLTKVEEEDVSVADSVLTISIPQAEILDVIMNPSDIKPFYDEKTGSWTEAEIHEARTQMFNKALEKLRASAIDNGILKRAEEEGVKELKAMFEFFGFKSVNVIVKEPLQSTVN